jgi:uncharacterized protein
VSIERVDLQNEIKRLLREGPVVALLGPRQSGKTTLARQILESRSGQHFDLEDPRDLQRLTEPMTALEGLRGLVVLDEIQRRPEIFPVLRVLADRPKTPARFLVLGSASPALLRQSSETLAGRIRFVEIGGFSLAELGVDKFRRYLVRGGFPRSFLARSEAQSLGWRRDFISTFIERDLGAMGIILRSPANIRRLWSMLAHRHGQAWNGAELAGSLGETYPTVKHHLDILTGALVVRQLMPFLPNLEKRVVRSPKVYIRDSGLLHALLDIADFSALERHPVLGASFEGMVIEELARRVGERNLFFHATHAGGEMDLVITRGGNRIGVEVKWSDAPRMTKSIRVTMADLELSKVFVVYPGKVTYSLADNVFAIPLSELNRIEEA